MLRERTPIQLFSGTEIIDYFRTKLDHIRQSIENEVNEELILSDTYVDEKVSSAKINPLDIDFNKTEKSLPHNQNKEIEIIISIPFSGEKELFKFTPSYTRQLYTLPVTVEKDRLKFTLDYPTDNGRQKQYDDQIDHMKNNVLTMNERVAEYNFDLEEQIKEYVQLKKIEMASRTSDLNALKL